MTQELVVLVGLQGAGKSTWVAERLASTHAVVSKDHWPNARRREARQQRVVAELLAAGRSVVVDNTNPSPAERAPLVALARAAGVPVRAVWLDTPPAVCLARVEARNETRPARDRVPLVGVHATRARFVPPSPDEGFDRVDVVRTAVTVPGAPAPLPAAVAGLAGDAPVTEVWRNELGGRTFAVGEPPARFAKWAPAGAAVDLAAEAARLRWAAPHTPVPAVLDSGADDDGSWLLTAALPGRAAVAPEHVAEPGRTAAAAGAALRAFHDRLPAGRCPFDWTTAGRVATVRRLAAEGRLAPQRWAPEHRSLGVDGALAVLADPPDDDVVVCHGDACLPNTLLDPAGAPVGHVDLGSLGRGDRWADVAVATWSLGWNLGPGWEPAFLDGYGVRPDPERTAYHRLLWDLCP